MKVEDIKTITVVGSGLMGQGIAEVCARAGYKVIMVDISDEILKKALEKIKASMEKGIKAGKLKKEEADTALARISTTTNLTEAVKNTDFVIEAIPEIIDLKKKMFKQIDEASPSHTIIASNTSSLMITDLASATKRPEKFIGMHWFNPPPIMKLIEIIRGGLTSDETYTITKELSKKLGKIPIDANDGPGFFTTRFLFAMLNEAIHLFESGIAGIKEIDTMCRLAFNHPMGPFELMDFIGIDTSYHILEYIHRETSDPKYAPPLTLKKMVQMGYLGKKPGSKGGFYDYFKIPKE